ncbi:hypothetical protein Lfu02_48950 [Longispora fulva]|uniref:Uncharacterized protein n=1 Tax=Longispora fulva TaxID=619741 RepID=A0A8J7GVK0_9ACTN|nr:hypothetical protein [Longispora fulva]MBG6138271.1 hypothetical protein [Longispora fulva]GIG60523.1 hypothetical protein Lfu02_48950 [Longispora fulva]
MNRDVQRVRGLLGPADPALSTPVGPGDPTGLHLDAAHDITPDGRQPVVRPRRAPRFALAGTFAAVLAVAGAVAVVSQLGGGTPAARPGAGGSQPGAVCLAALATAMGDAPADGQTGRYTHVRISQYGGPAWKASEQETWMAADGSGLVTIDGARLDMPAATGGMPDQATRLRTLSAKSATALDAIGNLGRAGEYLTRPERAVVLRNLADTPGVHCVGEMKDSAGRTGIAVTAYAPQLGRNPSTPLPAGLDCRPAFLTCQATLIFDKRTGELLARLEPDPADPTKVAYATYSERSRTDTLG